MPRLILALLVLLAALGLPPGRPAAAAPRCFPEVPAIADCIDGRIREFWEAQGGLPVFGYPIGPASEAQGPAGPITVQLFERARLEHHPQNAAPYDVLLGRLGADALAARAEAPAAPEPPRAGCRHFAATGLNVCGAFLAAYDRYGLDLGQPGITPDESLALFGLPLTAPREEALSDGRVYTVQWFERARFEDHGPQGVLFGLLGSELGASQPAPPPAPAGEPGGFIQVSGDQLTRLGRPITIKGVNYYPQGRPWKEMWQRWDGPQIARELRLARDTLGLNAVRVLLPYDLSTRDGEGVVDSRVIDRLRQVAQIAGDLDMRLIVALFDFYEEFPAAGTRAWRANVEYARTLIANFAGDDRIIAWDIHNEPDHYELWAKQGRQDLVLDWMGRMADEVRAAAPNHLVTVGMGQYQNLLVAGPDGRRPIDYSDLISVHIYNAADAARQLDELRRATGKPILLEEFGWPTGPECAVRAYTEAQQEAVYRATLDAARGRTVGVMAWTLRDYDAAPSLRWSTREDHYGLFRPDNTLKPAAELLRAYPGGEPLPGQTDTGTALSADGPNPASGERAPLRIDETGRYVKGDFRRAWDAFSGRFTFGPPISEVFERVEDRRVVQYYTGAVLEWHPEAADAPDFATLTPEEQIQRLIRPVNIGQVYVAGRSFPPQQGVDRDSSYYFRETGYMVDREFQRYYDGVGGRWRLGAPISPKIEEQVGDLLMPVQYFQNGRLEHSPVTESIEVGRLGSWAWDIQCQFVR